MFIIKLESGKSNYYFGGYIDKELRWKFTSHKECEIITTLKRARTILKLHKNIYSSQGFKYTILIK